MSQPIKVDVVVVVVVVDLVVAVVLVWLLSWLWLVFFCSGCCQKPTFKVWSKSVQ